MLNRPAMTSGTLFIISAPSGGGKTSLVNALLTQFSHLTVSVSHTTRAPRPNEKHGINYFFVDEATFIQHQQAGEFLESAMVFNHHYGTSKDWVERQLQAGIDVILEIDWQGAQLVKTLMPCVSIFILPPSREVLLARLQGRQQDSEQVIHQRMNQASQEISHYKEYDFVIINDNFDEALLDLSAIIRAQRVKTSQQQSRLQELLASLIV